MRLEDRLMDVSAEEGARVVALGLLGEAISAADALESGTGEEPLHDFRVAVRRLRSVLRTFRPWLGAAVETRRRRLGKLARATGAARDAEVQLAWLATRKGAFSAPRLRPGYDQLVGRHAARSHDAPDAARVARRFRREAEKLRSRLGSNARRPGRAGGAELPFAGVLAARVRDQMAALSSTLAAVRDPLDQEGVHRARIEGKRLRYLLEPLRGYPHADAREVIGRLKRLQDLLGELHDVHVLAGEVGSTLLEAAVERARRLHAAAWAVGATGPFRQSRATDPRAGLLALLRLARERRDALHAKLDRGWREGGVAVLSSEAEAIASALEARARAPRRRRRSRAGRRSRRSAASPRRRAGGSRRAARSWVRRGPSR